MNAELNITIRYMHDMSLDDWVASKSAIPSVASVYQVAREWCQYFTGSLKSQIYVIVPCGNEGISRPPCFIGKVSVSLSIGNIQL